MKLKILFRFLVVALLLTVTIAVKAQASKDYFTVENVKATWNEFGGPVEVNSFKRPLEGVLTPLTDNGFYIDKLVEPKPTKEFEQLDPKYFRELNEFPAFMCIRAVKRKELTN